RTAGAPRPEGLHRRAGHGWKLGLREKVRPGVDGQQRQRHRRGRLLERQGRGGGWLRTLVAARPSALRPDERRLRLGRQSDGHPERPLHRLRHLRHEWRGVMNGRRVSYIPIVAVVGLLAGFGGRVAWAAIPDGNTIHACYKNDTGVLRAIDPTGG